MAKYLIVAGHGEGDPGAVGNGYKEADLTREFSEILYRNMKILNEDVTLYPFSKDLYQQRNIAEISKNYDEIIEVHYNAATSSAEGAEVLIHKNAKADNVDKACLSALGEFFVNRGFKERDDLFNMNNCICAYRLLEICFITNKKDIEIYQKNKEEIGKKMAENITGKKVEEKTNYSVAVLNENQYNKKMYFAYYNNTFNFPYSELTDLAKIYSYYPDNVSWEHRIIKETNLYEDSNLKKPFKNKDGSIKKLLPEMKVLAGFSGKVEK